MLKLNGTALCIQMVPSANPPLFHEVDCKLTPEPGSLVCIRQTPRIELDRVMVCIHAEFSGVLERALASRNPVTGDWEYVRKTTSNLSPLPRHVTVADSAKCPALACS